MNDELERMCKEAVMALFKVLSQHLPGRTEKSHEETQDSGSSGRDLNTGLPEYEAGVLHTRPRHCVFFEAGTGFLNIDMIYFKGLKDFTFWCVLM
jgi:hypothetical protein